MHLIRNVFDLASKRDWDALKRDTQPIYTAVNTQAARDCGSNGDLSADRALTREAPFVRQTRQPPGLRSTTWRNGGVRSDLHFGQGPGSRQG